jgi:hypothetical protein
MLQNKDGALAALKWARKGKFARRVTNQHNFVHANDSQRRNETPFLPN